MKFKEFSEWCNRRAADGCWGSAEALACIRCIDEVNEKPWWKREKFWQNWPNRPLLEKYVDYVNSLITELAK